MFENSGKDFTFSAKVENENADLLNRRLTLCDLLTETTDNLSVANLDLNANDLTQDLAMVSLPKPGFKQVKNEAEELMYNDLDAYLLMCQIMFRARRESSKFSKDKLLPGQALIGDYEKLGMTRQRYRDAQYRLEDFYKLATFKGTNKGTIATLLNTEFCDINLPSKEPSKEPSENHQRTTNQYSNKEIIESLSKDKDIREADASRSKIVDFSEEEVRKTTSDNLYTVKNEYNGATKNEENKTSNKKTKKLKNNGEENVEKTSYRDYVKLTEEEYKKLLALHGERKLNTMLDILNAHKGKSGQKYKSDYYAMDQTSWVVTRADEYLSKSIIPENKKVSIKEDLIKRYRTADRLFDNGIRVLIENEKIIFVVGQSEKYYSYSESGFWDKLKQAEMNLKLSLNK